MYKITEKGKGENPVIVIKNYYKNDGGYYPEVELRKA